MKIVNVARHQIPIDGKRLLVEIADLIPLEKEH